MHSIGHWFRLLFTATIDQFSADTLPIRIVVTQFTKDITADGRSGKVPARQLVSPYGYF